MLLKNKIIFYIIILGYTLLQAEWGSITLKEHVDKSTLIVIAEFQKEVEKKEVEMGTTQLILFESNETIKGDINGSFFVKGQAFEICMAQKLFTDVPYTKYLLFLEQEGNTTTYNLVHGERSALEIKNGLLGWIADRKQIDRGEEVMTSVEEVKREIGELR